MHNPLKSNLIFWTVTYVSIIFLSLVSKVMLVMEELSWRPALDRIYFLLLGQGLVSQVIHVFQDLFYFQRFLSTNPSWEDVDTKIE